MFKPGDRLQDCKTFMSCVFMNFWLICYLHVKLPQKLVQIQQRMNFPYGICWKQKHAQRFEACRILTTLYPSLPFVSVQESTSARGRCQNGISMSVCVRHVQQVVFFANMPWKIWKTNEPKHLLTSIIFSHPAYSYSLMKTVPVMPEDWSVLKSSQSTLQHHTVHTLSAEMFNKTRQL